MASVRVPGFTATGSGFHFANSWSRIPLREFDFAGQVKLDIGDAANGLCGGMCYTAADLHAVGHPPGDAPQPGAGSDRFEYIVERQFDSFGGISMPLRLWGLMSPTRPDREPPLYEWLGRVGIDRHSRTYVAVHDEWPKVRAALDGGDVAMLALVRIVDSDPFKMNHNHQVLAYGYDLDGGKLTLHIYDPNWPNDDTVTLRLDVSDPRAFVTPTYSKSDAPVLGFFRTAYAKRDPAPWR